MLSGISAANLQGALKQAIVEGEAHAVGLMGPVGTIRMLGAELKSLVLEGGHATNSGQGLARSFGGSESDEFIEARLDGLRARDSRSFLPQKPRRGFDALVEALQDLRPATSPTRDDWETLIAHLLRTSRADRADQLVRNLATRLIALRSSDGDPR